MNKTQIDLGVIDLMDKKSKINNKPQKKRHLNQIITLEVQMELQNVTKLILLKVLLKKTRLTLI